MGTVIGIDLGTTNSCVAVIEGDTPTVITNKEGYRTTPSVVAFTKSKELIVGDAAKRQAAVNSDRTIFSIKRHMGTDYRRKIDGKYYTPQEISAFILMKLKEDAEDFLGQPVTDAVVTVPAYFTDAQRQATKDAGKIAGLNILRIINEPTSAALAYGLDNGMAQKVLVYDLGGGTFDVSVIDIGDNVIEVLATSGDNHLGGDDFDERIVNYLVEQFKISDGINLSKDVSAMQRLREEAEKAKKELSSSVTTNINLPFIAMSKDGPHHIDITLSRQTFNDLTADLVDRTITPVENALHDAGLSKTDINMVLLVGGSTRIPAVADKVRQLMGKEPSRNLNPDECVALGAAVQGGKLVFQYAQTVFEGMKAYTTEDGHIVTFRPDLNAERMANSAKRLEMPVFPEDRFVDAIVQTVKANAAYVPPYGSGATLYVRPYMMGTNPVIGVKPADEYMFRVFTTPVGPYFKGGAKPITIRVSDFDRAAPHGTGHIKAGLNYAMSLHAIVDAHKNGFDENMYLDAATRTKVEETGGANFIFVTKDGKVVTPKSDSILPSITRRSLIYVAKEYLGLEAEEREIYFDEVKDFAECGLCGTAAVISPVGKINDHGKEICFPSGMEKMGPVIQKLYDTLTGIQMGRIEAPKGWIHVIE